MSACCAAVELGGTRAAVVAGHGPERHSTIVRLATSTPDGTLASIVQALQAFRSQGWDFAAVGVASFGPLDLDPASQSFGRVLQTPKPGWSGAEVLARLSQGLGAPVVLETDVNAAAVGEAEWGACRGLSHHAYVTAGTGVGVGLCVDGAPVHGLLHPEAGHLLPRRDPARDPFAGVCRWHGDCVEGLASGPAIAERVGQDPETIEAGHQVWSLAGDYLGQLCAALTLVMSAQRIVLGGGVGRRAEVIHAARQSLASCLAGYLARPEPDAWEDYLVAPQLGADSGLYGALALAQRLTALSARPR